MLTSRTGHTDPGTPAHWPPSTTTRRTAPDSHSALGWWCCGLGRTELARRRRRKFRAACCCGARAHWEMGAGCFAVGSGPPQENFGGVRGLVLRRTAGVGVWPTGAGVWTGQRRWSCGGLGAWPAAGGENFGSVRGLVLRRTAGVGVWRTGQRRWSCGGLGWPHLGRRRIGHRHWRALAHCGPMCADPPCWFNLRD